MQPLRLLLGLVALPSLTASLVSGQIDTTRKEFYPLQVGNVWQYRDQMNVLYSCRITAADSIFPNGMHYFVGCDAIRIDSLLRILSFRPWLGDTCGGGAQESNIFRLNEPAGSRWRICENIVSTLCRPWFMRFDGIGTAFIFGQVREVMRFTPGALCPGMPDTSWYLVDWLLVRGIGVYRRETIEGQFYYLTGAIINGVQYGTIVRADEEEATVPRTFSLMQNYPNPFNPATTIEYALPEQTHVELKVYDMLGKEVASLVDEQQGPGTYRKNLDPLTLATGVYVYRLSAGKYYSSRLMAFVK